MSIEEGYLSFLKTATELGIKPYQKSDGIIYHYTTVEKALLILQSNGLMFTPPSGANDPFELTNSLITVVYSKEEMQAVIKRKFKGNHKARRALLKAKFNNQDHLIAAANRQMEEDKALSGIFCFSKTSLNTLLWSHYGDRHRGVCLGFSLNPYSSDFSLFMHYVRYAKEIVPLNWVKHQEIALLNWLFTKSHHWAYEEEVRAVKFRTAGLARFPKEDLVELYFGLKCPSQDVTQIKSALQLYQYPGPDLFKMDMNNATYDLKYFKI